MKCLKMPDDPPLLLGENWTRGVIWNENPWFIYYKKYNFPKSSAAVISINVWASTKAPTLDPTQEPTIEAAGECAPWCQRSSHPKKCSFADCSNCLECNDVRTEGIFQKWYQMNLRSSLNDLSQILYCFLANLSSFCFYFK